KSDLDERDWVQRSASLVPAPARQLTPVAKLIDVSKCIGCKACQVACLEWNDMRERVGLNVGVYDNPGDLTPQSFTVMRFTEWVNPETQNLEWLIRKDGCMHCEDPGCLKACPAPGAIVQYTNGIVDFVHDACHRVRHQGGDEAARRRAYQRPQVARLRQRRPVRSARRQRHPCDVRA